MLQWIFIIFYYYDYFYLYFYYDEMKGYRKYIWTSFVYVRVSVYFSCCFDSRVLSQNGLIKCLPQIAKR